MSEFEWQYAVERMNSYIVKINTPTGSGTGFQISRSETADICAIATAAHVINHAHYWENPIRIFHQASNSSILLRPVDRVIIVDEDHDTAAILFSKSLIPFPDEQLQMTSEGKYIKIGNELGWLGYPSVSPQNLCFFSGRASCWVESDLAYLVDGVAINGVSGGPTFLPLSDKTQIIVGVVSAYVPNRATGIALPGVCIIQDVKHFHDISKRFKSMDEAKKEETPPVEPISEPANGDREIKDI